MADQERQDMIIEVTKPVIERDDYSSLAISLEGFIDREHSLSLLQRDQLALEHSKGQIDLLVANSHSVVEQDHHVALAATCRDPERKDGCLGGLTDQ